VLALFGLSPSKEAALDKDVSVEAAAIAYTGFKTKPTYAPRRRTGAQIVGQPYTQRSCRWPCWRRVCDARWMEWRRVVAVTAQTKSWGMMAKKVRGFVSGDDDGIAAASGAGVAVVLNVDIEIGVSIV
jgi:hypothetical protein